MKKSSVKKDNFLTSDQSNLPDLFKIKISSNIYQEFFEYSWFRGDQRNF